MPHTEIACLAGGCFWGMEDLFRSFRGVVDTEVGYMGGEASTARYANVKTGSTGHAETLRVEFDASKISFEEILDYFFTIHDPTTKNAQGNDWGQQYRSAIFAQSEEQSAVSRKVIEKWNATGQWPRPIVTEVCEPGLHHFYPAEKEHQDYLVKHPGGYTCHFERPFKAAK